MKFGESLYQRSVPKWASYNVNYNELKHLIKARTTNGTAIPVAIPGAGTSRWQQLDNELFGVIKDQYQNIALFLRSKQGEIDRRLIHLEKQVRIAQRAIAENALDRPILQARKYQRLVKDNEAIGDEIENLSRFVGVQKTAFRKILKKYRKWTGSTNLQTRLDVEVFSSGELQVDYTDYLQRLSAQTRIMTEELATPMLTGQFKSQLSDRPAAASVLNRSSAPAINEAVQSTPLDFDVALSSVPYGEVAGSAFYWIHPDNFVEAQAVLLRHMRMLNHQDSAPSAASTSVHIAFYDNIQRFTQDNRSLKQSNIALNARWNNESEAIITLSSLAPKSAETEILKLRRKDLSAALQRSADRPGTATPKGAPARKAQNYLSEHRDVKPLALATTTRTRFVGITNSAEVGAWATLDSHIHFATIDSDEIGQIDHTTEDDQTFPYSVLHIRWEFSRMPEVVRTFDSSHLVERVQDFSLESAAVHSIVTDLEPPKWRQLLTKDIRKLPKWSHRKGSPTSNRLQTASLSSIPASSGPSSTDGPSDSIFSIQHGQSSATSEEFIPETIAPNLSSNKGKQIADPRGKKKRARIIEPSPRDPSPQRYWNEFDDGDSDTNVNEGYAIYVDPNESTFPGAETVSKAFGAMYESFSKGKSRVTAWLPLNAKKIKTKKNERTPLLFGASGESSDAADADEASSGSESDEFMVRPPSRKTLSRTVSHTRNVSSTSTYRPHQPLTSRQKKLERTLLQFYSGLITVSYVFLAMAGILLGTGRRKAVIEVDAGVICGVVAAETCSAISGLLVCMRRQRLSALHWGFVAINIATIVVVGIAILSLMFVGR